MKKEIIKLIQQREVTELKLNEYLEAEKELKEQADSEWGDPKLYAKLRRRSVELMQAIENLNKYASTLK